MNKLFSVLCIGLFMICTPFTLFAEAPSGGISVTPSLLRVDLEHDADQQDLVYTNHSTLPATLRLQVRNFTALEDGRKVRFLEESNVSNFQYSLASWIKLSSDTIILNPNETASVQVYIDKEHLTPGAHYASIQAIIEQGNTTGTLGVRQALASLLFVRGAGGAQHADGTIQNFTTNAKYFSFPSTAEFSFNNTGNIESAPYGELKIISQNGKLVAKGIVNNDSLLSLPESVRTYPITIQQFRTFLFPAFYTATLSIHLDQNVKEITHSQSFFSLGSISIRDSIFGAVFLALILIIIIRLRRR